jgi:hypothetical protein
MDTSTTSYVEPKIRSGKVICECGSIMEPEICRLIGEPWRLYWRCWSLGHVTCTVPIPAEWFQRPPVQAL